MTLSRYEPKIIPVELWGAHLVDPKRPSLRREPNGDVLIIFGYTPAHELEGPALPGGVFRIAKVGFSVWSSDQEVFDRVMRSTAIDVSIGQKSYTDWGWSFSALTSPGLSVQALLPKGTKHLFEGYHPVDLVNITRETELGRPLFVPPRQPLDVKLRGLFAVDSYLLIIGFLRGVVHQEVL